MEEENEPSIKVGSGEQRLQISQSVAARAPLLHLWLVIHDLVFPFIALAPSRERGRPGGRSYGIRRSNKEWNFHMEEWDGMGC